MQNFILQLSFLVLFCGWIAPSQAQQKDKPVNSEDVAIAFYKTAGITPQITDWIKKTDPYKHTPAARRPDMLLQEKNRIIQKYNSYDPKEDILLVHTKVNAEISETELINGNLYQLDLNFVKAPDAFYFPYTHAGNNFALMPYGLQRVLEARIDEAQYNFLKDTINSKNQYSLILRLRAKESVSEKPYNLNGTNQWILKTEIGSIELWSNKNTLLWENHAAWYVAPNVELINKLYSEDQVSREKFGTVKIFKE